jgi:hypothetical protein
VKLANFEYFSITRGKNNHFRLKNNLNVRPLFFPEFVNLSFIIIKTLLFMSALDSASGQRDFDHARFI